MIVMSEEDILTQLKIVGGEHTIKVHEEFIEETMPASVVHELRLNNFSAKILLGYINNLQNQLQQKENIIKEVREYIKENVNDELDDFTKIEIGYGILEILDKGE